MGAVFVFLVEVMSNASDKQTKDAPPLKIYEHSRAGFRTLDGTEPYENDPEGISVDGTVDLIQYSQDGEYAAIYMGDTMTVYRTANGSAVSSFQHAKVKMIAFSPQNTLLQTWQYHEKPTPGTEPTDNLILWNIETGQRVHSWLKKQFSASNWPFVKWTSDESVAALMGVGRVDFFAGRHFHAVVRSLKVPNIAHFSWAPGEALPHKFAVFVPEKKGQPGRVQMCNYPETNTVVLQKSIFKAQGARILWNQQGTAALLIVETDVDTSGKSYYGETGVHLLDATNATCTNVRPSLDKQGPIYETVWSPRGDKFVVTYGSMPSKTTLFNLKLERLMDFPIAHRNTAIFCPHGHTLIIAGFGNLPGVMDIWDVKRGRKITTIEAPCTTECNWSPCSSYILTSTLTPRLRVDNGWKIWTPTGTLVKKQEIKELYRAIWKPLSASRYPSIPPKKTDSAPNQEPSKPVAKPATYCPPHLRNRAAAEKPQPKAETASVAQKFVPESQKAKSAAPPGQMSKAALKNKKRAEKKRKAKEAAQEEPTSTPADSNTAQPKKSESDKVANQKRAKAIKKKLRQIEQLKEKEAGGTELNDQEKEKVGGEADLRAELKSL